MDLENVRLAVYDTFARHGRPPTIAELFQRIDAPAEEIRQGLQQLAEKHCSCDLNPLFAKWVNPK